MAIAMMAFFVSCGEVPEEENKSKKVNGYIDPLVDDKIDDSEARLIERACVALRSKKRLFNNYYANSSDSSFSFEGVDISCNGVKSSFQSSARIIGTGNNMSYKHSSDFAIKDIIFDDSTDLNDYCDTFVKDRYVIRGSRLRSINARANGSKINIVLSIAQKNSEGKFRIFLTDSFVVAKRSSSVHYTDGFILQREITDTSICNRGARFKGMKMLSFPGN